MSLQHSFNLFKSMIKLVNRWLDCSKWQNKKRTTNNQWKRARWFSICLEPMLITENRIIIICTELYDHVTKTREKSHSHSKHQHQKHEIPTPCVLYSVMYNFLADPKIRLRMSYVQRASNLLDSKFRFPNGEWLLWHEHI